MLLDVRRLIELLRSAGWAWTAEAIGWLFGALELQASPSESRTPVREFQTRGGLLCLLHSEPETGAPLRFEFLFPVPKELATPERQRVFLDGCAWPLKALLGVPAFQGSPTDVGFPATSAATYRLHWAEPKALVGIESRRQARDGESVVALTVEPAA